jgi:hypothetical protein
MISKESAGHSGPSKDVVFAGVDPACRKLLDELLYEFDRGVFLKELWTVRRLMDRHCDSPPVLRSRARARTPLFRMLAGLDLRSLSTIHDDMVLRRSGKSDLGIIADAILGRT